MTINDPRPLTRKQLAEFLPTQRAVRAFEKLFDLIPSDFIETGEQLATNSGRISLLENPTVVEVAASTILTVDAYVIKVVTNGLTITLPKGVEDISGRTWTIVHAADGPLTIETSSGDSLPTPGNAAETSLLLKAGRRGSAIALRYLGDNVWGFA